MGLRTDIQRLVKDVFASQLGDLAESVTYRSVAVSYTPSTGVVSSSDTDTTVKAVFVSDSKEERNVATPTPVATYPAIKCLLSASALSSVTPKINDKVIRASGETWIVASIKLDPAQALYSLQMRRP